MVKRILLSLLILLSFQAYSLPSSVPASESMICLTSSEWDELEAQIKTELETAVNDAVNEAVKPYILVIEKKDRELMWWKIGTGAAIAGAIASLVWAAVK